MRSNNGNEPMYNRKTLNFNGYFEVISPEWANTKVADVYQHDMAQKGLYQQD